MTRACLECDAAIAGKKHPADFCSPACRKTYNNRRLVRGAELYDVVMAMRYDRDAAKEHEAWKLLCRLAQGYREEDLAERGGRKSWRSIKAVVQRHGYAMATAIARNLTWRTVCHA